MVVLHQPREEHDRAEFEEFRGLQVDHPQVQPPFATVGGHPDRLHRQQQEQSAEHQKWRAAHQAFESYAGREVEGEDSQE